MEGQTTCEGCLPLYLYMPRAAMEHLTICYSAGKRQPEHSRCLAFSFSTPGSRCFHMLADLFKLFAVTHLAENTYTNAEQEIICCTFRVKKITIHILLWIPLILRYYFRSMAGWFTPKFPSSPGSIWILTGADPEIVRRILPILPGICTGFSETAICTLYSCDTANVYDAF